MPKFIKKLMIEVIEKYSDLSIDCDSLLCTVCEEKINFTRKHGKQTAREHVESKKHINNKKLKDGKPRQSLIGEAIKHLETKNNHENKFYLDLAQTFIEANIPLKKLNHPSLKSFMEKYIKRIIPNESTLRKDFVEPLYNKTIEKIKTTVGNNAVYFILDETTDSLNRYVLNILVGPLNGYSTKTMLLCTKFLTKTNHSTVSQ